MVVKEASYEVTDPTVDSQVVTLQGSGADTLIIAATPGRRRNRSARFTTSVGGRLAILSNPANSIATVLESQRASTSPPA